MKLFVKNGKKAIKKLDEIFFDLNAVVQPLVQISLHEENLDKILKSDKDKELLKSLIEKWAKFGKIKPESMLLCESHDGSRKKNLIRKIKKGIGLFFE